MLGWVKPGSNACLKVRDEQGNEVSDTYFTVQDNEIRLMQRVMPVMHTVDKKEIRQECF
jgi:hypothetical protein